MMKKIYAGALLVSIFAQQVFAMEEERKSERSHIVVRSPEEQEKLNEKFLDAVLAEDLDRAEELISQGADVNAKEALGKAPLRLACELNSIALVKLLLLHADVNVKNNMELTCLHLACSRNFIEIVKILLAHKDIQVNVADYGGETPLHKACLSDDIESAKLLLKSLTKPTASWQQVRLMWIGHLKEEANCNLAKLPSEMICYILSFCGGKRNNIEALKNFICHKNKKSRMAFYWSGTDMKKELGHILDPQAWQDDQTVEKTYDALVKRLQKDEEKQSSENGLQQE